MGDFHQTGLITTLHRLGKQKIEEIEQDLNKYTKARPLALVLPALYIDLQAPAMKIILNTLKEIKYINQIVVTLGKTNFEEFKKAKELFSQLPQPTKLIWNNGERISELFRILEKNGLQIGEDGKGRSAWMAYGYILSTGKSVVIALHDCDILTYERELLARLCYPIISPNLDYEFCKGYYPRVTNKMHGRVTRLFITPIIRTLQTLIGYHPFLAYLDSFRYPLAGEFAMLADLARVNRIPSDWGLEIGVLAEIYRNCAVRRICQVELCETYEHKHQPLSEKDPSTGLLKMSIDIAKTIFRNLATEGVLMSEAFFHTLQVSYLRTAQDFIKRYHDDAEINKLDFDRHEEERAIEAFSQGIKIAGEHYMKYPMGAVIIPNWSRITSAIPDFLNLLNQAVEEDNKM